MSSVNKNANTACYVSASVIRLRRCFVTMQSSLSDTLIFYRETPLYANDCMEVVETVAREFSARAGVVRTEAVVASALQREAEDSTCVGRMLAVPHARVEGLSCAGLYLVRVEPAVNWPTESVKMVAFLAVPEETPEVYLQMLSQLVRWWVGTCAEHGEGVNYQAMADLAASLTARLHS